MSLRSLSNIRPIRVQIAFMLLCGALSAVSALMLFGLVIVGFWHAVLPFAYHWITDFDPVVGTGFGAALSLVVFSGITAVIGSNI